MNDALLVEHHDGTAVVTMNLPEKRNALAPLLVARLSEVLSALEADHSVRAVVLSGGRNFCAGGDLSSMDEENPIELRKAMVRAQQLVRAIAFSRLPVVAAVEGTAFGAGMSLAMACDHVVADAQSSFCAAFAKVGLMPDLGLVWSLSARVGQRVARELVLFADVVKGEQAKALGLVDLLAEPGQVAAVALQRAKRLAQSSPNAIAATKTAFARLPMPLDLLLAWEADAQTLLMSSLDFKEGCAAFFEKRAPNFRGA